MYSNFFEQLKFYKSLKNKVRIIVSINFFKTLTSISFAMYGMLMYVCINVMSNFNDSIDCGVCTVLFLIFPILEIFYIHCIGLSDCLLYWGCQNPLPKDSLLKILLELKKVPSLGESHSPLDPPHLCLFLTFLVSLRVGEADSGLDSSLVDEHYPFLADIHSISLIHQEVTAKSLWNNGGLEAAVKFAWAVFLRECSSLDAFKGKRQREREREGERRRERGKED